MYFIEYFLRKEAGVLINPYDQMKYLFDIKTNLELIMGRLSITITRLAIHNFVLSDTRYWQ